MATTKQLEANRLNARKSTGPKSAEGREIVKSNALRDGIRSVQTVVPGQSAKDWNSHHSAIVAELATCVWS
jgi:hypothetical protein